MSGFSYPQPTFISSIYNPGFYLSLDASGYLTYNYAKTIFLDRNDYRLSYLSGISVGVGTPGTALVLNGSSSITSGLVDLTASGIVKAATINATSGFQLNGTDVDFSSLSYVSGITAGTAANGKALVLSNTGSIGTIASLTATNITGMLQTSSQPNITSLGTLTGLNVSGTLNATTYQQGGTTYNLSNFISSSTTSLPNLTSHGTLTALSTNGTNPQFLSSGLANAEVYCAIGKSWSSGNCSYLSYFHVADNNASNRLRISIYGSATPGITIVSNGNVGILNQSPGYALDVSGTCNATTFRQNGTAYDLSTFLTTSTTSLSLTSLTATNLTGTLQTAAQPNITSIGTLSSLTVSGSLNGTLSTASQSNITSVGTLIGLTFNGSLTCQQPNTLMDCTAGTIYGSTSLASTHNLILRNFSTTVNSTCGLAFISDNVVPSSVTPSWAIISSRLGGSYGASDLLIHSRTSGSDIALSPMLTRLWFSADGRATFSGQTSSNAVAGNQDLNLLKAGASVGFRMGAAESARDSFTIQYSHAGTNSASNRLSVDWYGTSNSFVITADGKVGVGVVPTSSQLESATSIWCNEWFHTKNNGLTAALTFRGSSYSTYTGLGSYSSTTPAVRFGSYDSNFNFSAYCPVYGGAYSNVSDQRLKKDIVDIPYGLETVMAMQPRQFKWRQTDQVSIGFIAQELEAIVPEPVSTPEGDPDELNSDGLPINTKGVDYACLTAVLCKAIQELKAEVDSLKQQISQLT